MPFHPYLNFGGNCRAAFERYQEIFGGELYVMDSSEMPSSEEVPADLPPFVVHAAVTFADGQVLMGSDDPVSQPFGPVQGMHVNFATDDAAEARRVFDALAAGGTIAMPFGETFWSSGFGMCTDAFGTPWMVNVNTAPAS